MKWALRFLLLFLAIELASDSIKTLTIQFHVPNVTSALREVVLYGLFLWGIFRLRLFQKRRLAFSILGFMIFLNIYVLGSAFEDKLFAGVYYARIYAVPVVFFVGCYAAITRINAETLAWLLRRLAWFNILFIILAFIEYGLLLVNPTLQKTMLGSDRLLASAWYISGGIYMRMGLPFTSPNSLGTYCGMTALVSIFALVSSPDKFKGRALQTISFVLSLAGVLGSFSRSSLLLLLAGLVMLFTLPGFRQGIWIKRVAIYSALAMIFAVLVLIGLEVASDGYVSRWLALTAHGRDPSIQGHLGTFKDAYANFNDYFLYGYNRGTVGPQSELFGHVRHNAENSTIVLAYDMGLPFAAIFIGLYTAMLSSGWVNRAQMGVVIGFFLNTQVLPEVFAMELMCYFLFVYLLIGAMVQHGFIDHLLKKVPKARKIPLYVNPRSKGELQRL